jgi:hypothetical protein
VHFADIGPCCAAAGNAFRAAADDAGRADVRSKFVGWLNTNRAWFECRAYAESVKCADEQLAAQKCSDPSPADPACCNELRSYRADKEQRRQNNCASGGNLTDCPFAGSSSQS